MPPSLDRSIAIIGGGISGLTTAVMLQLAGHRTILYTRLQPRYEASAARPPEFATPHAAASVLPHSVASPHVARWTAISQAFFRVLSFPGSCGVRRQLHYEISEAPADTPPYAKAVENFRLLTEADCLERSIPRRTGARAIHGWVFDAFFCDAPEYLGYLQALYAAVGGTIRDMTADGSLGAYFALGHVHLVNCAGLGAYQLVADDTVTDVPEDSVFEPLADPFPAKLIRGHYLRIDIKHLPRGAGGRFFSYNYKPVVQIYRTATGGQADVYCYPRLDAWLLGGSRQEGRLDPSGNWVGEDTVNEATLFPRRDGPPLAVPSAILQLNSDILRNVTDGGLDLETLVRRDPAIVSPGIGYRFVRDSETDSIRIGCSRVTFRDEPKYVLHNYGHGGSGFTLSWGCAFDMLLRLETLVEPTESTQSGRLTLHHDAIRQMLIDLIARLRPADGGKRERIN
jgi:D-amino-acid oxidase